MYQYDSDYVYDEEHAVEGEDYWFIEHQGQKGRVQRVTGGGQTTDFGGPCGPIYTDSNGEM